MYDQFIELLERTDLLLMCSLTEYVYNDILHSTDKLMVELWDIIFSIMEDVKNKSGQVSSKIQ